jgi:hypothetical protein
MESWLMSERSNNRSGRPSRTFRAGEYIWSVHEIPPPADGSRGKSLVFSRVHVARRVWSYPENWFLLSDEELARLVECR